jgi:CheY-like chemotaxis protein
MMQTSTHPIEAVAPLVVATETRPAVAGSAGRVLIVDDDPALRQICAINLAAEGLYVLEAEDGFAALELVRTGRPDLVLTDVMMPGLDGFELAERLRVDERTARIPLFFLTGETGPVNMARADELGARAYVTKPFDPGHLAALVADEIAAVRCFQ